MTGATVLECQDVSSGYADAVVISGISLQVKARQILAVLGKNGMGKTTLLKTIMGFVPPSSGTIRMSEQDISRTSPEVLARAGIAYIPQEEAIFQDLSVEDNLRLALARDRDFEPGLRRIADYFPVIAERRKQKAGTLSGGEQKMLLMARALIVQPKVILVDEISEGLQPTMIAKMADALVRMAAENDTSILLVEQNVGFVAKVAHEVALLKIGQIVDRRAADTTHGLNEPDLIEMMRV